MPSCMPESSANFFGAKYRLYNGSDRVVANTSNVASTWTEYTITRSGTTLDLYRNGTFDATGTLSGTFTIVNIGSGNGGGSGGALAGKLDEIRISNTARSADWINAAYKTMTDTYNSFGSEEPVGACSGASSTLVMTIGGQAVTYCVAADQLRRHAAVGSCDASSEAITSDKVNVSDLTFGRLENTNIILSKTMVSIQMEITINSASTAGEKSFSASKITTISLK